MSSGARASNEPVVPAEQDRTIVMRAPFAWTHDERGAELTVVAAQRAELQRPIASRATAVGASDAVVATVTPGRWRLAPVEGEPAEIVLASVVGPRPFRDVLVSWNVDVSASVGFAVDVRVARSARGPSGVVEDAAWSNWMEVGVHGDVASLARATTTCQGGRVATDYFAGADEFGAAQVRVRAVTGGSAEGAVAARAFVDRLTVCLSDVGKVSDVVTVADAAPRSTTVAPIALDVPYESQHALDPRIASRVCSPTSVAMVLAYHGVACRPAEVAARAYDAEHDLYGNWPRNVQAAYSFGIPGCVTRLTSFSEAERIVASGRPLVISLAAGEGELRGAPYARTSGHLIVVTGFEADGGVRVNDPAAADERSGRLVYSRADLARVWLARGGTCYVFDPPGRR